MDDHRTSEHQGQGTLDQHHLGRPEHQLDQHNFMGGWINIVWNHRSTTESSLVIMTIGRQHVSWKASGFINRQDMPYEENRLICRNYHIYVTWKASGLLIGNKCLRRRAPY